MFTPNNTIYIFSFNIIAMLIYLWLDCKTKSGSMLSRILHTSSKENDCLRYAKYLTDKYYQSYIHDTVPKMFQHSIEVRVQNTSLPGTGIIYTRKII